MNVLKKDFCGGSVMKRKNVFILVVSALLAMGATSCGSDNDKKAPPAPITSSANPIGAADPNFNLTQCQTSSSFEDFRNKVHAGQFVTESYNQETYYFEEYRPDKDKWWIFTTYSLDRVGSFQRSSTKGQDVAVHEAGTTKTAVLNYLKSIVDNKVNYRGYGSYYEVLHSNGMIYGISLCSTLAANPVFEADQNTGDFYVYRYGSSNNFSYPYSNFGF